MPKLQQLPLSKRHRCSGQSDLSLLLLTATTTASATAPGTATPTRLSSSPPQGQQSPTIRIVSDEDMVLSNSTSARQHSQTTPVSGVENDDDDSPVTANTTRRATAATPHSSQPHPSPRWLYFSLESFDVDETSSRTTAAADAAVEISWPFSPRGVEVPPDSLFVTPPRLQRSYSSSFFFRQPQQQRRQNFSNASTPLRAAAPSFLSCVTPMGQVEEEEDESCHSFCYSRGSRSFSPWGHFVEMGSLEEEDFENRDREDYDRSSRARSPPRSLKRPHTSELGEGEEESPWSFDSAPATPGSGGGFRRQGSSVTSRDHRLRHHHHHGDPYPRHRRKRNGGYHHRPWFSPLPSPGPSLSPLISNVKDEKEDLHDSDGGCWLSSSSSAAAAVARRRRITLTYCRLFREPESQHHHCEEDERRQKTSWDVENDFVLVSNPAAACTSATGTAMIDQTAERLSNMSF